MRAIGNFLWFILGGVVMGLAWWLVGLVALLTIVGIPWAKASFVIGQFSFFPFGKEAISRKELHQADDIGTGRSCAGRLRVGRSGPTLRPCASSWRPTSSGERSTRAPRRPRSPGRSGPRATMSSRCRWPTAVRERSPCSGDPTGGRWCRTPRATRWRPGGGCPPDGP